ESEPEHSLIDLAVIVGRESLQSLLQTWPVALLILGITSCVRLRPFLGHAYDLRSRSGEIRERELIELRSLLTVCGVLRDLGLDLVEHLPPVGLTLGVGDELAQRLLGLLLLLGETALQETVELALRVRQRVVETADVGRRADLRFLIVLRHLLETRDVVFEVL